MSDDDRDEIQLPPAFLKFQAQLKADKKTLMRDEAYGKSPAQLRAFIGTHLFQRFDEMIALMGFALYDTYMLAVSSENQLQRMRAVHGKALKKLGADIENEDGDLPGVSPDVLNELQQAFYAIGTLLQKKLPNDPEMEKAYNRCAEILGDTVAELLGEDDDEDEDDDRDDDDREDDEDEGEEGDKASAKSSKKKDEPKPKDEPAAEDADV